MCVRRELRNSLSGWTKSAIMKMPWFLSSSFLVLHPCQIGIDAAVYKGPRWDQPKMDHPVNRSQTSIDSRLIPSDPLLAQSRSVSLGVGIVQDRSSSKRGLNITVHVTRIQLITTGDAENTRMAISSLTVCLYYENMGSPKQIISPKQWLEKMHFRALCPPFIVVSLKDLAHTSSAPLRYMIIE